MTARHKQSRRAMVPAMPRYRLETKSADWPDPSVPEGTLADPSDPNAPQWAGDLYEEGDESDPVEAFAAFTGTQEGQTAWLDVSPDGTMTGWVKDGEQVYRYTDPQAWALDVDGAAMTRAGELSSEDGEPAEDEGLEGEEDLEGDDLEGDEALEEEAPEGEPVDGEPVDEVEAEGDELEVDDSEGHDPNGDTPKAPGDAGQPENVDDPAVEAEGDEAMEPEDDNFYTRMKKKGEKKSLAIRVRQL